MNKKAIIVGGGLAGCEAAWQAAERGVEVLLYEMRPGLETGAHVTPYLAELVCSNSLGSKLSDRASGILKEEIRLLKSLLLICAEKTAVPAGGALAVDRDLFSKLVTKHVENHPNIRVIRQEVTEIPDLPTIIASGPLTSARLSKALLSFTGQDHLFFFDAIAPIVSAESINLEIAFKSSRYQKADHLFPSAQGDYINCPLDEETYYQFVDQLTKAKRIEIKDFETDIELGVRAGLHNYFEGCLPVEVLARRGKDTLAFGPMRPIGLINPKTGKRPYAVLQLRQDNLAATLYNMVGFQTNLTFQEQKRIFRSIPGLENANFERFGQMHRNTFIFSPNLLKPSLQSRFKDSIFFAGQIIGVEGYIGNIATGLLAGINMARYLDNSEPMVLPEDTMLGALTKYVTSANAKDFQPMKANLGILPPLQGVSGKLGRREKAKIYSERAISSMKNCINVYCV